MKVLIQSLFFTFFSVVVCSAQQYTPVNYKAIQEEIADENSDKFYPSLMKRYEQGDTSLTNADYRHLYYGFTFQDEYRPYDKKPLDQTISQKMTVMNDNTLPELQQLAQEYLQKDPFSLKMLYYLLNFNNASKQFNKNEILQRKYDGILQAILSSGNGQGLETGYSVNHPSDEYMILRSLDLKPVENDYGNTYDYFQLAENSAGLKEIYFDVERMATIGTKQLGIETVEVENEEVPEDGVIIGSEQEMKQYIPLGYQPLFQQQLDIDGDGDQDWIIVTKIESEENLSDYANERPELRELMILRRNDDKQLEIAAASKHLIPCIDCGSDTDPFLGLDAEEGKFTVYTAGGDLFKWERDISFELVNEHWIKTKEEFSSYRKGKEENKQTDTETAEDFGTIHLSEFNYYELLE